MRFTFLFIFFSYAFAHGQTPIMDSIALELCNQNSIIDINKSINDSIKKNEKAFFDEIASYNKLVGLSFRRESDYLNVFERNLIYKCPFLENLTNINISQPISDPENQIPILLSAIIRYANKEKILEAKSFFSIKSDSLNYLLKNLETKINTIEGVPAINTISLEDSNTYVTTLKGLMDLDIRFALVSTFNTQNKINNFEIVSLKGFHKIRTENTNKMIAKMKSDSSTPPPPPPPPPPPMERNILNYTNGETEFEFNNEPKKLSGKWKSFLNSLEKKSFSNDNGVYLFFSTFKKNRYPFYKDGMTDEETISAFFTWEVNYYKSLEYDIELIKEFSQEKPYLIWYRKGEGKSDYTLYGFSAVGEIIQLEAINRMNQEDKTVIEILIENFLLNQ